MLHYTLNTGHTRTSPRSEVGDDVIAKMASLLGPGHHDLGRFAETFRGYHVTVPECDAGLVATLWSEKAPLVTFGVAATEEDEDVVWPVLEQMYLKLTELPVLRSADFQASRKPDSLPWLAVVLVAPHLVPSWVADFERCLAWAWLEKASRA